MINIVKAIILCTVFPLKLEKESASLIALNGHMRVKLVRGCATVDDALTERLKTLSKIDVLASSLASFKGCGIHRTTLSEIGALLETLPSINVYGIEKELDEMKRITMQYVKIKR